MVALEWVVKKQKLAPGDLKSMRDAAKFMQEKGYLRSRYWTQSLLNALESSQPPPAK